MTIEQHIIVHPAWLDALVETVMEAMTPLGFVGPLGYRWWAPGDAHNEFDGWLLVVYPSPYETIHGSHDGQRCVSGFNLDLVAVTGAFAELEEITWAAPVAYAGDLDGPSVFVQGRFAGKHVRLQLCHLPPQDEAAACKVDTATGMVIR